MYTVEMFSADNNMERHALQMDEQQSGHYQLRRLLGEGGFGQVYEAWDTKLQRIVAIKRLKAHVLGAGSADLLGEARMAASLRHPAFVKIFSIDGDAEQQSIIMEFVDGSSLGRTVTQLPLSEDAALDIVCQVAEAMQEAHASQLIHGDIKPSNLMREHSGKVRIMDFGLARKVDPQATETAVIGQAEGTIAYLAPELLTGTRPSAQSDVYALGVVLYELVTGERPFAHLNGLALAAAHIQSTSAQWVFPSTASTDLVTFIRAMTARDLSQRLPTMRAVREAGLAVRSHSAPPLLPVGGTHRYRPAHLLALVRRRRAVMLGAAALVLAFGVGGLAVFTLWGTAHSPFFSEANAMSAGFAALRNFDPDTSADAAVEHFSAVLARNPNHAAAAAGLGLAYASRYASDGRDEAWLQRADASSQLAIKLNDQLALAHVALGTVRHHQGKLAEALQMVGRAALLDPLNPFAIDSHANILIGLRRFEEAERIADRAIKLYPKERLFRDIKGTILYQQGKYKEAEAFFRQSIELDPNTAISYANLNAALLRLGRSDEALAVLQQGLQVRPSGQLYSNLGVVLFDRGDYVGASKAFEHAVSSSKGNANSYLRWANLADTLRWIPGREDASRAAYKEAVGLLKTLLDRSPSDVTMQSRMGLYAARIGDKLNAVALSAKAVQAAPASGDVRFRAAIAYELSGNRENALAEVQNARARGFPANLISSEPDLVALRRDPRYHQPTIEGVK